MTKRLMAMFIALMMLLSAFILAGCTDETTDTSSDASGETSGEELTPKQLFESSIKNLAIKTDDVTKLSNTSVDTVNLTVDKLVVGETDVTQLGAISLSGNAFVDKNGNADGSFELSAFGEKMPYKMTIYNKELFVVDFLGLNDKPIKMELPETTENVDGAVAGNAILANTDKLPAITEHVIKSIETVINANVDDSMFTAEDKDVTVLGKEFKNAKIITLTVDDAKLEKISNELIDELMKNEDVKKLFGDDFDKAEAVKELEDFKSLRIVNTVVDETTVALNTYIDYSEAQSEDEATAQNEEVVDSADVSATEESKAEVEKEDKSFAISIESVDKNFFLEMGFANADGKVDAKIDGAIVLDVKDDGSKFSLSFKTIEDDETEIELIKANADIIDGEYKGVFTIDMDRTKIDVDFYAESTETTGTFGINKITVNVTDYEGNETKNEIPLELYVNYKIEENKLTADGKIKFAIENMANIEASFDVTSEYKDVTVEAVTDSITMEEFQTEYDDEAIGAQLNEKYPKTFAFLALVLGSKGEAEEDEQYFESEGLGIWLPMDFSETYIEGYTTCYTSDSAVIVMLKEDFQIFANIENFDFDAYVKLVYEANSDKNPSPLNYEDIGVPYCEYKTEKFGYLTAMYEGADAYWIVQFICDASTYDENKADFLDWAYYIDPLASEITHTDGEAI